MSVYTELRAQYPKRVDIVVRDPRHATVKSPTTARDLAARAADRQRRVPLLLALTVLVETLKELADLHRRGQCHGAVDLAAIRLNGPPLDTLLADPSRDPHIELAAIDTLTADRQAGFSADVYGAGAAAWELLTGAPARSGRWRPLLRLAGRRRNVPPPVHRLLVRLLDPRPEQRPSAATALAEAREHALEALAAWDRQRSAAQLEERLCAALDEQRQPAVRELVDELIAIAPGDPMAGLARRWLATFSRRPDDEAAVRHRLVAALYHANPRLVLHEARSLHRLLGVEAAADPDLAIARGWLAEVHQSTAGQRAARKRTSLKLALTTAPILLAVLLLGLLATVLFLSV